MPKTDGLEPVPRRELTVFYVLDTSGSMQGEKIAALNRAMEECTNALTEVAKKNADAKLKIAILKFDSDWKWITEFGPEELEDFEYEGLEAGGLTNIGAALKELNDKMSSTGFLQSMTGNYKPVVIFMTDGFATDDYEKALMEIRENKWFRASTKIGFAVGDDADGKMLANIVGNNEAVIKTTDLELFAKLIVFASVTSSLTNSKPKEGAGGGSGADVIRGAEGNGLIPPGTTDPIPDPDPPFIDPGWDDPWPPEGPDDW